MPNYFETYRAVVRQEECDHLGHWNVQYYIAAISEAAIVLSTRLGLDPGEVERRGLGLAAVHMAADFLAEMRVGEELRVETALLGMGGKSLKVHHRMHNLTRDVPAFTADVAAVFLDLAARKAVTLPPDVRDAGQGLIGPD